MFKFANPKSDPPQEVSFTKSRGDYTFEFW